MNSSYLSQRTNTATARWMAPEVLRNEPSNEKADVYSFGVILHELMTGEEPWKKLTGAQVIVAVGFEKQRLPIPEGIDPDIK